MAAAAGAAAQGVSRQVVVRAAAVGVAAGCMGTWTEMSHGVVCIPVLTLPPLQLSQQAAIGSTVFGVSARQVISATLYAVDPSTDLEDFESLQRVFDVPAAGVLAASGTAAALSAATLATKLSSRQVSVFNGFFLLGVSLFMGWRESRVQKAQDDAEAAFAQLLADRDEPEEPVAMLPPGIAGPVGVEAPRPVQAVRESAARDDLPRLLGFGLASGTVLGLFGIGPAWMLAPLLSRSAKPGQLGAPLEEVVGPRLADGPSLGAFATDERTRTTACMAMVPPSIAAAFRHYQLGNVPNAAGVALPLAAGAVLGSAVCGQALADVPCEPEYRQGIAGLLFAYGSWMVFRPLFA